MWIVTRHCLSVGKYRGPNVNTIGQIDFRIPSVTTMLFLALSLDLLWLLVCSFDWYLLSQCLFYFLCVAWVWVCKWIGTAARFLIFDFFEVFLFLMPLIIIYFYSRERTQLSVLLIYWSQSMHSHVYFSSSIFTRHNEAVDISYYTIHTLHIYAIQFSSRVYSRINSLYLPFASTQRTYIRIRG